MVGLGIPSSTQRCGGVTVAYGNSFDNTACIVRDGRYIMVDVVRTVQKCERCSLVHSGSACLLPAFNIAPKPHSLAKDCSVCLVCGLGIANSPAGRLWHFGASSPCLVEAQRRWWHGVTLLWDRFNTPMKLKLAVK